MLHDEKIRKFGIVSFFVIVTIVCISGCNSDVSKATEVRYMFDVSGDDCKGIQYGWLSEEGINQSCHEHFTNGDVRMDCPTPNTVTVFIERPNDPGSYITVSSFISVSSSSICVVQCEIWIKGDLEATDNAITIEDDHIASCRSRVY
jgi:hypothetical protein